MKLFVLFFLVYVRIFIVAHDWPAIAAIAIDIERVLLAFH